MVKIGIKYPFGPSPKYPPRDWTCKVCKKYHTKPHYAFPGQIDYSKQPTEPGRVKFNREGSQMDCSGDNKHDTPYKEMKNSTGDYTKKNGGHAALFCPHCGDEEEVINIIKVVP